jgi:hypothetical protein
MKKDIEETKQILRQQLRDLLKPATFFTMLKRDKFYFPNEDNSWLIEMVKEEVSAVAEQIQKDIQKLESCK